LEAAGTTAEETGDIDLSVGACDADACGVAPEFPGAEFAAWAPTFGVDTEGVDL
jgi:hypothetical protein